jgi:nitrate reductase cytochrome c-type subunit
MKTKKPTKTKTVGKAEAEAAWDKMMAKWKAEAVAARMAEALAELRAGRDAAEVEREAAEAEAWEAKWAERSYSNTSDMGVIKLTYRAEEKGK